MSLNRLSLVSLLSRPHLWPSLGHSGVRHHSRKEFCTIQICDRVVQVSLLLYARVTSTLGNGERNKVDDSKTSHIRDEGLSGRRMSTAI